jgi:hypothetical protein
VGSRVIIKLNSAQLELELGLSLAIRNRFNRDPLLYLASAPYVSSEY